MRHYLFLGLLVLLSPWYLGVDSACVTVPPPDGIVAGSPVSVEGAVLDEDGNAVNATVRLRVNGAALAPVAAIDGRFVTTASARVGTNFIEGTTTRTVGTQTVQGTIARQRFERKTDLVDAGRQLYFLDFTQPEFQAQIRMFLSRTLSTPLSTAQLNTLRNQVQLEIGEQFQDVYERSGLRVVRANAPGANVTTIRFDGRETRDDGRFGEAIPQPGATLQVDYLSTAKNQLALIFGLSIVRFYVDQQALFWGTPARATDSPEQRATDIANIFARTGIHELAHTLGLVAEGAQRLNGCNNSHNCPAFDDANELTARATDPFNFMTVERSSNVDFGSTETTRRVPRLSQFNNFNLSYLRIIH